MVCMNVEIEDQYSFLLQNDSTMNFQESESSLNPRNFRSTPTYSNQHRNPRIIHELWKDYRNRAKYRLVTFPLLVAESETWDKISRHNPIRLSSSLNNRFWLDIGAPSSLGGCTLELSGGVGETPGETSKCGKWIGAVRRGEIM
jgi:hypothetical protein